MSYNLKKKILLTCIHKTSISFSRLLTLKDFENTLKFNYIQ